MTEAPHAGTGPSGLGAAGLRVATAADAPQISALMRESVLALFPHWYDERRTASAAVHVAHLDTRPMFVRAGWTRRGLGTAILAQCERAARGEGFRSSVLGATLPGVPLYRSFGFREVEPAVLRMPDGVQLRIVVMERPLRPLPSSS